MDEAAARQLEALRAVGAALADAGIDYWLFGGWGVDFHVGEVTRPHGDVDLAVWLDDIPQIVRLPEGSGWRHAPEEDEDGGTGYERDGVRLELTYLVRAADGSVVIPLRAGPAKWAEGTFGEDIRELQGVHARVVARDLLVAGKSRARDDPGDAAKDRADYARLSSRS